MELERRCIVSYPDEIFLTIWGYVDGVCATVLLKCSFSIVVRHREAKCGKGFLSLLTVIMQLVFECSYRTNVDRLHFQIYVPGSCQPSTIFISALFLKRLHASKWFKVCSTLYIVSCTFILEADINI